MHIADAGNFFEGQRNGTVKRSSADDPKLWMLRPTRMRYSGHVLVLVLVPALVPILPFDGYFE